MKLPPDAPPLYSTQRTRASCRSAVRTFTQLLAAALVQIFFQLSLAPGALSQPANSTLDARELEKFRRPENLSPDSVPIRPSARLPQANVKPLRELGKTLFFDPRLSASGLMSCATCHNPSLHWTDGLKSSVENITRRSMSLYNLAWDKSMTWRGGPGTVTSQAIIAITAPRGMNGGARVLENGIAKIPAYKAAFSEAYTGYLANPEQITLERVTLALDLYTTSIISPVAPFDRWMAGDTHALNASQIRGFDLFRGKAKCSNCHDGWRFTTDAYHDIGLKSGDSERNQKGELAPFFKAVGLRNIADRPPYMHDGSLESLESVVAFYNRGGDAQRPTKSPLITPLSLSSEEMSNLVSFLHSLSGKPEPVTLPILPR